MTVCGWSAVFVNVANSSLTVRRSCNQMLEGCWGLWPSSPTWLRTQSSTAVPLHTWHPLTTQTVRNIRDSFLGIIQVLPPFHLLNIQATNVTGMAYSWPHAFYTLQDWARTAEAVPLRVCSSSRTWSPRPPSRGQTRPPFELSFTKFFSWARWDMSQNILWDFAVARPLIYCTTY